MLSPTNLKSDTITLISDFMDIYKIEISDEYKQIAKFSFGIEYIGSALYYAFVKEVEINNNRIEASLELKNNKENLYLETERTKKLIGFSCDVTI